MPTIRVRIPRHIQPVIRHLLSIRRRCQQTIHHRLLSSYRIHLARLRKRVQLLQHRRQSRQIQRHPPQPHLRPSLLSRTHSLRPHRLDHKRIQTRPLPRRVFPHHLRFFRPHHRRKGPMPLINRPLFHPSTNQFHLFRLQRITLVRWRHHFLRILRHQPIQQRRFLNLTRHHHLRMQQAFLRVQSQIRLPRLRIRPMTRPTMLRQQWPDLPRK